MSRLLLNGLSLLRCLVDRRLIHLGPIHWSGVDLSCTAGRRLCRCLLKLVLRGNLASDSALWL